MVQSAHVRLIGNFGRMQKNQYPMALCYNGRDHYAPTRSVSLKDFYQWKMEKELGPVLSGALFIIEEIDRTKLPPNVLQEVNEVEAQIVKSLPIISPKQTVLNFAKLQIWMYLIGGLFFPRKVALRFLLPRLALICLLPPQEQVPLVPLPLILPQTSLQGARDLQKGGIHATCVPPKGIGSLTWMGIFGLYTGLVNQSSVTYHLASRGTLQQKVLSKATSKPSTGKV